MQFGNICTEPFSCCLRHAEVITNQRNLGTIKEKEESMILFVSASRNVKYVLIHLDWQNTASTSLPERIRCEKVNISQGLCL